MSLPLIYIAGPFRGPTPLAVRRNVEAARDLGLRVAQAGGYPVIPHTMTSEFDKQLTDQFWLDGTLELLKRCDAIVLAENFGDSVGARTEYAEAVGREMPTWVDWPKTDPDMRDRLLREFVYAVASVERVRR